jgi:hypothetical protein
MDTSTAAALFNERKDRAPDALAVEVIALRAVLDRLGNNLQDLKAHIGAISVEDGSNEALVRGAGGIAVVEMLDAWLLKAMGDINDVAVMAVAEDWSD